MYLSGKRVSWRYLLAAVSLAGSAGVHAQETGNAGVNYGSGIIIGTPIVLHNLLHFQQEADRFNADYRRTLAKDGGTLTPADHASFQARYRSFAARYNSWVADGQAPTKFVGSNIARRSSITTFGRTSTYLPAELP